MACPYNRWIGVNHATWTCYKIKPYNDSKDKTKQTNRFRDIETDKDLGR